MEIKETLERKVLNEGRNTGMGFALLKRSKEIYETVNPLSPCKDYLNEVVFTENTGIPTKACGLNYPKKNGIFKRNVYLALKIVTRCGSEAYYYSKNIKFDQQMLRDNYKNIKKLINDIEEKLGIKGKTTVTQANNDYFLVKGPLDWRKSTISISLYTLLIRCAMAWNGEGDPMDYLRNYKYNVQDVKLLKPAFEKLLKLIEKKELPEQPAFKKEDYENGYSSPHNLGILSLEI